MTITDYDPTDKKSLSERDIQGWMPRLGQRDAHGYAIPPEVYYGTDFDKRLVIEERTQFVAHLDTQLCIQVTQRFVEKKELRLSDQGSCHSHALLLPAAQQ